MTLYEFGSCIDDDGGCVARLKEEEDGQAVRSADSKNWWPGFQGGPTAYVWHELPSAIAPILDSFPSAASPRL